MFGFPKRMLRKTRDMRKLTGLLEIHHVIPQTYKNHAILKKFEYDTEEYYNLVFCPSKRGKEVLNLRPQRPNHTGGHIKYNYYVSDRLDECETIYDLYVLWVFLHLACKGLRFVPWK